MLNFIDAHCHLQNMSNFQAELEKARIAGIKGFVCNSTGPDDWDRVLNLSAGNNDVYGCIGIHPWRVQNLPIDWEKDMYQLLQNNPSIMIGEIGLDKFASDTDLQENVFKSQLNMAADLKRTVHIHCVGAWDKMLRLLKGHKKDIILHSFSASDEVVKQLLKQDNIFYSFSSNILNKNHKRATNAITKIPLEKILVESDDAEPSVIIDVVKAIANIKSVDYETVADRIYANSLELIEHGQAT